MALSGEIAAAILLILAVVCVVFFRKKFFALVIDLVIGTVAYLAIVFGISILGLSLPLQFADIGYVITLIALIGYHIAVNVSNPRAKAWGAI